MTDKTWGVARRIWSAIWRTVGVVRTGLANLIFVLLIVALTIALLSEKPPPVPNGAALVLDSIGHVVEKARPESPLSTMLHESGYDRETLLQDLVDAIEHAATDARIETIVLPLEEIHGAGISKGREIGAALTRFRAAGKNVIASADWLDQDQYLLASYADEIWLNPAGDLLLQGFGLYRSYFREGLDKIGVDVHVFRAGEVKDAAEPLQRNNMAEATREANRVWLEDLWNVYSDGITERRNLPAGAIDNYINNTQDIFERFDGNGAIAARQFGLVDELKTRLQVVATLRERLGSYEGADPYPAVHFQHYLAELRAQQPRQDDSDQVAVVVAQGIILPGTQAPGFVGADGLAALITSARDNDRIRALVLRIDSPGGVMFAGELIREALVDLQNTGKPVVVSMGAMAASGGYQISSSADEIWAHETTLTGSIGVLMQFPTIDRALARMGVHSDGIGTTDIAGGLDITRPLGTSMQRRMELSVQNAYSQFLQQVSQGREMTLEQVRRAAEGQVWTGRQAHDLGLVDRLGGLKEAVHSAAELAGLSQYEWLWLDEPVSLRQRLLGSLALSIDNWLIGEISAASGVVDQLRTWFTPQANLLLSLKPGLIYGLCESCPFRL